MPISIRPLTPVFAGEVAGLDCRRPLDPQEVAAIEAGMDRYAVLVYRDQPPRFQPRNTWLPLAPLGWSGRRPRVTSGISQP